MTASDARAFALMMARALYFRAAIVENANRLPTLPDHLRVPAWRFGARPDDCPLCGSPYRREAWLCSACGIALDLALSEKDLGALLRYAVERTA